MAETAHEMRPIRRVHRSKRLDFCALGELCTRRHDFLATCSCGWRDCHGRRMFVEREATDHLENAEAER